MINVKDTKYGAIGKGISRTLGELYVSLAEAKKIYPHATSLDNQLDWAAIQLAINDSKHSEIFIPDGNYLAGGLEITRPLTIRGCSSFRGNQSSILVADGNHGIIIKKGIINEFGDGSSVNIQNLSIQSLDQSLKDSKNGIFIDSVNGVRMENINVRSMGHNGIEISSNSGANFNSNSWQMYSCFIGSCNKNGLYTHGQDSNAGTCIGLDTRLNHEWGIYEAGFLGNTYISCVAHTNGIKENGELIKGGSFTVRTASNYSSFVGCYAEDDNFPDFRFSQFVSVVGGNLAQPYSKWDENSQKTINVGARNNIGHRNSKQIFKDRKYFSKNNNEHSEIGTLIPAGHYNDHGLISTNALMSNISWYYNPPKYAQEVYDKNTDTWIQGIGKQAHWHLNRFVKSYTKNSNGEAKYYPDSLDRCWNITEVQPVNGAQRGIPFGWTDRQHPLGSGHFFFGNSIANQKNYFSWKQRLGVAQLDHGITTIPNSDEFPVSWINKADLNSLFATFSIEFRDKESFAISNIQIASHYIDKTGEFEVKVLNNNIDPIDTTNIYLNCHFEKFEKWPHKFEK